MAAPALSHCGQLLKTEDYDRFAVSLFAPAACREALWALYAFNLEVGRVRYAVREPLLGHIRLQWWRETIDGVYRGTAMSEPVSLAIAACLSRHRLRHQSLQQIIDSCEADLLDPVPQCVDDLVIRLGATTEPLVTGALDILGVDHAATRQSSQSIGLATALVGLIRGRLQRSQQDPLKPQPPQADAVNPPQPHAGPAPPADVTDLAARASDCLRQARAAEVVFDRQSRAILLPATLAQDHLARLRRTRYRVADAVDARRHPAVLLKLALHAAMRRY
jgi:phytoene synthase